MGLTVTLRYAGGYIKFRFQSEEEVRLNCDMMYENVIPIDSGFRGRGRRVSVLPGRDQGYRADRRRPLQPPSWRSRTEVGENYFSNNQILCQVLLHMSLGVTSGSEKPHISLHSLTAVEIT